MMLHRLSRRLVPLCLLSAGTASALFVLGEAGCSSSGSSAGSGNSSGSGSGGTSTGASSGSGAGTSSGIAASGGAGTGSTSGGTPTSGSTASGTGAAAGASSGAASGASSGNLSGASSGTTTNSGSASGSASPGVFALTSPSFVGFDPDAGKPTMMTIPTVDTCDDTDGGKDWPNGISPELDWTAGPAGTMSYVITLVDTTINNYHWSVWDIPATVLSLPAEMPKGSPLGGDSGAPNLAGVLQNSFQNNHQYVGPCPAGAIHTYQFTVYALSTPTLNVAAGDTSEDVFNKALEFATATATLTGASNAKTP
jgi:Raf kinase inhibitor-like YbhB/YbcL family protein